jgi:hypothetical protein
MKCSKCPPYEVKQLRSKLPTENLKWKQTEFKKHLFYYT